MCQNLSQDFVQGYITYATYVTMSLQQMSKSIYVSQGLILIIKGLCQDPETTTVFRTVEATLWTF